MVSSTFGPIVPRTLYGPFVHHSLMSSHGSPVPLLKFQMALRIIPLISSVSTKQKSQFACLSEASHSQKMWIEVSNSAPHLLHKGLQLSPIKYRCLLRVSCLVRKPVTTLDYVLIKNSYPSESLVEDASLQVTPAQPP